MYLVPKNVKNRFEFFPGFGWMDLGFCFGGAGIGLVLFLITGLFTHSLFRVFFILFFTAIGFIITRPHPLTKRPLLVTFTHFKDFSKKQKRYYYRFGSGR